MSIKYRYFIIYCLLGTLLVGCGESSQSESASVESVKENPIASLYNQTCVSCHLPGVANAPKAHDLEAWGPRLDKGMDTLLAHTKNGLGAMPRMGMCSYCSDEDFINLINYMSSAK